MSTSAHPNHEVKGNRPAGKGRGASNTNDRGNTETRRARKAWLIETYRADRDLVRVEWSDGRVTVEDYVATPEWLLGYATVLSAEYVPTCRCYRCPRLLWMETVTVDKIFTKPEGGTYRTPTQDRREKATNIRPACNDCNSITGAALASQNRRSKK